MYYKTLSSCDAIYLILYVDDMFIACKLREEIEKLNDELSSEFGIKNLGPEKRILGMKIVRNINKKILFFTQADYATKVLDRFGMLSSKPVFIPLAAHIKLSKQQEPIEEADVEYMMRIPYSSATGSIMYAMVCTKHVVAFGISVVSRYMGNIGKSH